MSKPKNEAGMEPLETTTNIKGLQKEWQRLSKPLEAVGRAKLGASGGLEAFRKVLAKVPAGDVLGRGIEELRRKSERALSEERKASEKRFRAIEAELIKDLRARKTPIKELDYAWRIDSIELEVQREQAQARALYNHEQIVAWSSIASADQLSALLSKAKRTLEQAAIPETTLVEAAWDAREALQTRLGSARLPIVDFYREFRIALLRRELSSGKPDKRLKHADLPKWAFLYNLDLYRQIPSSAKRDRVLNFETGSQMEQSAGKGLVLNGLDPRQDRRVFCYVVVPKT